MDINDIIPSVVGRPAGVRDAGVRGGVVGGLNLGSIDRNLSDGINAGLRLYQNYRNEADQTAMKEAFNNANRELDTFLNESIFSQQGLNAQDSVTKLTEKYDEIRYRYGSQMNERQRQIFDSGLARNYNSRLNQTFNHQRVQGDRAAATANAAGMAEQMKILVQTGTDSGFPAAMAYLESELSRQGLNVSSAMLAEYEKKNKIEVDPSQGTAERIAAAEKNNPEYAKILKAYQYGADQQQNYIDQVQLQRVKSMLDQGDAAGAKSFLNTITSPGYRYTPSPHQIKQLTQMVTYADRTAREQRTADGYVAEALGGVSATRNYEHFQEIEAHTINQIKNLHEGEERERLTRRVKAEFDDRRRLLIAEHNRILSSASADMAGMNATQAQEYISKKYPPDESEAPGAVSASFRSEIEKVYKARYGYLPENDPIAANASKMELYQGIIDGSMVWNNQDVEITSKEDAYNMAVLMGLNLPKYMREIDKTFDSREARVPPKAINDQLMRLGHDSKPGKTALSRNPGLYEWVNSTVPAGREKDTQAIQAAVSGYLVNQGMASINWWPDKAMPLGEIKGNKKYFTAAQMNQVFNNWVQTRRMTGKAPAWANSSDPDAVRRFAVEVLGLRVQGKEYWAPKDAE